MSLIPRVFTAMVTPYDEDLRVNYDKAAELAEYLVNNGSDGLVVSGTTGEAPVLKAEEQLKLCETVKRQVGDRVEVWAGTGSNCTAATVELNREVEKLGVDGVLLVNPYYNKPTQEGLYQHYKTIAEHTDLPIMLYNIPGRTGGNVLPETILRLSELPNLKAIKEASGDINQMSLLRSLLPERVAIYSGDDSFTLPLLAVGGAGVVSVASHIVGKEIKAMVEAFLAHDTATATALHLKMFPVFRGLFMVTNPIPVKEALNLMGMNLGGFRLPLTSMNDAERGKIRALLRQFNLLG